MDIGSQVQYEEVGKTVYKDLAPHGSLTVNRRGLPAFKTVNLIVEV